MTANKVVATALWKGCLGGVGIALVFLIISGAAYLLLSQLALPQNLVLFVAILSGPLLGTIGLILFVWFRRPGSQPRTTNAGDETTSRDTP